MKFDVEPIYGWGWRLNGQIFDVPGPFRLDAAVNDRSEFTTDTGKFDDPAHPLSGMWIVISPMQAAGRWEWSHLCAFPNEPVIAADLQTLVESAPLTGFAKAVPL